MTFEVESVLGSLAMGLAVALLSYASRDYLAAALDAVEKDLAEKLRRLRASTRRLRAYLIAWLAAIAVLFSCFWLLLDNLTFAVLISLFLAAGRCARCLGYLGRDRYLYPGTRQRRPSGHVHPAKRRGDLRRIRRRRDRPCPARYPAQRDHSQRRPERRRSGSRSRPPRRYA